MDENKENSPQGHEQTTSDSPRFSESEAGQGQTTKKPPRRAVVIFGAIFVVIVVILSVIGRGLPQKETQEPIQSPDTQTGDLEKTYESPLFTLKYPDNWKTQFYNIKGGGSGVTIQPNPITADFPRIDIESSPINPAKSIARRLEVLSPLKFEVSSTEFNDFPATKLTGRLPFLTADGKPLDPPVRKTYIFFENNGYLYIITYVYYEDDMASQKEEFFSNVLGTMTLPEGAI